MDAIYVAFTAVMLLASLLCGAHAWRNDDHVFYAATIVYGLLLEKLVILYFDNYTYPAAEMLDAFGIPLAIGFGWSAVIYSGYVTARALDLPRRTRPVFVAVYAVHLDLAMDAIAIRVPYWTWASDGAWFGVPLGNFLGWYLVALFFTLAHQHVTDRTTNPALAATGTILGALLLLIPTLELWTTLTADSVPRKTIILAALLIASLTALRHTTRTTTRNPRPIPHTITAAVLLFHGYFLAVLLHLRLHTTHPLLLALSLTMTATGLLIHAAPHLTTHHTNHRKKTRPN